MLRFMYAERVLAKFKERRLDKLEAEMIDYRREAGPTRPIGAGIFAFRELNNAWSGIAFFCNMAMTLSSLATPAADSA